jgi:hypothetical protein
MESVLLNKEPMNLQPSAVTLLDATVCDRFARQTFNNSRKSHAEVEAELDTLAQTLSVGVSRLGELYLRICDLIRDTNFPETDMRRILGKYFPPPRVSEFLRVANASEVVYRRYRAGFFGFKAALRECRGYDITPSEELRRRQIRRAAERLATLAGCTTVLISKWKVSVSPKSDI